MKKIHWVLLVVVGLVVGSLWFSGDDEVATCHSCACVVGCCESGVCDIDDCDCSCKD